MAQRPLLKYRNPDSTQDINDRLAGLFAKGIFEGGSISPVSGVLRITLSAFSTVGSDGMFVKESDTTTLDVVAGVKNYVVIRQQYISNAEPVVSVEVLPEDQFQITGTPGAQGADNPFMLVFGTITLGPSDTQVSSAQIDYLESDSVDKLGRSEFRGLVSAPANLPSGGLNANRAGDFYIVTAGGGDAPLIYAWDGVAWNNITDASLVQSALDAHSNNANANEKHLTDLQAAAMVGTEGVPDGSNPYVTDADTRFPTQDQQDALAGNGTPLEDTLPSSANKYITSSKVFAAPEEVVVPAGTWIELGALENADGYYVGTDIVGTAGQWFSLYSPTATEPQGYINEEFEAVLITNVRTGPPGGPPSAFDLNPSADSHVDSTGFFIPVGAPDVAGTLFLILDQPISSGGARAAFGKRTLLGNLLPHLFMKRGPQTGQINTAIARLLTGTPNAQFDDDAWTTGIAPGKVVGWNNVTQKFVLADPLFSSDLNPVGVRGNANNLVQEGLINLTGGLLIPGPQYADKANPGDLTNTENEWFIGRAINSNQLLVNMNGIALQSSGEVTTGVAFPAGLFDGALQAGQSCAFGPGNTFERADINDPARLPVGIKGSSNTVIMSGKYTALSGAPFIAGVRYYAATSPGVLTTNENDWYVGIGIDTTTLLVHTSGVAIPSKWTMEHDEDTGNHAFRSGGVGSRPSSPVTGTIFLRTDTVPPTIEYWTGSAWALATSDTSFPSGTAMLFMQASVPTGWTLDSSVSDAVIRLVDDPLGVGVDAVGGVGGSWTISGFQADGHALTEVEMPAHYHVGVGEAFTDWPFGVTWLGSGLRGLGSSDHDNNGYNSSTVGGAAGASPGDISAPPTPGGAGDAHTHTTSNDGVWRPAYRNVIVCIKD